jgi:pimeloyl-ACP methyl ester carboxylesterase
MPTITLNQQAFFYAHHKNAQAAYHVILIHGAGGTHLVWPAALRRLPGANVYALDLPGHGRSAGNGYAQVKEYADSVVQFIKTLALDKVVLIGHSMGGAIAQTIALRQLPEIAGLVLIGTGARLRVSPAILDQILPNFEQAITAINQFSWSAAVPPEMAVRGFEQLRETEPGVLQRDFLACDQFDVRAQLAEINAPTLVIAAAEDQLTPPKFGRFLADNLPQAQFVLLENAGHMMMVEKPGETAEAVREFLRGLGAGDEYP